MSSALDDRVKSAAEQATAERNGTNERWAGSGKDLVESIVYNMRQRTNAHGIKKGDHAVQLHKMLFDETYFDVYDADGKDLKVRLFFEPLVVVYNGNTKLMLADYKYALTNLFPIPSTLNREWNPKLVTVSYKPKRKFNTRTTRTTVRHDWSIKKMT